MGSVVMREHAGAHGGADDDSMFIAWTSFLQPTEILQYDFASGETTKLFEADRALV